MNILKSGLFKYKLFRGFAIAGIIPLILMAVFSYYNTSNIINKKIDTYINQNLHVSAKLIDSTLSSFVSMTDFISQNEDVQRILKKKVYSNYDEKFDDVQTIYKLTSSVLSAQKLDVPIYIAGRYMYGRFSTTDYFPPVYEYLDGDIYKAIDSTDKKFIFYIHRRAGGKDSRDITLSIVRQIKNVQDGEKLGYVIIDVYDDYFDEVFNNEKMYSGSNIYLMNKDGTIITDMVYKTKTGFKFYSSYADIISSNKSGQFTGSIGGKKSMLYYDTLSNSNLKIVQTIPLSSLYSDRNAIVNTFLMLLAFFSMLAIAVSMLLADTISKPVNKLSMLMNRVEKGDMDVNFDIKSDDEIGRLGRSFNRMVREVNRLIKDVYEKQYLLKEAELKSLKHQIDPHFLYNTLESINWMSKLNNNEGVSRAVIALGKLLRYSMSNKGDIVPVREEIEQVKNYLEIQKLRFTDRFQVIIEIEDDLYEKNMLKLLLQPLIENAIVHGLEQKRGKGNLLIKGYIEGQDIVFEIRDDGVGMGNSKVKGEGIGMENVGRRIKLQYGDGYGIAVLKEDVWTCVRLVVPDIGISVKENDQGIGG